jgi:nucleoside-diphosphate-sugar epimerase
MRLLLTGAAGLIGTHLTCHLEALGYDVVGVDKKNGDLRELGLADSLITDSHPNVVVHLAALTGREFGDRAPNHAVTTNALASLLVAKACAAACVRLVYISTSEAFGDHADKFVHETDSDTLPHNIYGLSKRWGEEASRLYAPDGLQILRLSMPYGPGFPAGFGRAALITFLWNAIHGRELTVHRNATRAWCWIGDLIAGIRMVIEDRGAGMWTIGRDDNETSMLNVARMCCDAAGKSYDLIREVDAPANQTLVKRLPNERLRRLGWAPTIELREGIQRTCEMVAMYDDEGMPTEEVRNAIRNSYTVPQPA